jgi:Tfp pilus assembly protein PilF
MHRAACQWKKKAYREAVQDARQAVTIDPDNENAHWQLVSYYSALGESVLANYHAERMRALRQR